MCHVQCVVLQTKIHEVLQMKKMDGGKLWVSDECMVLDAVRKVTPLASRSCSNKNSLSLRLYPAVAAEVQADTLSSCFWHLLKCCNAWIECERPLLH